MQPKNCKNGGTDEAAEPCGVHNFLGKRTAHAAENAPKGTPVYYLNGEMTPSQLKELGCAGLDYHYDVLRKHPEWIDECHRLGMKVNVWTVRNTDVMREFDGRADFLTTDLPAEALKVVNK